MTKKVKVTPRTVYVSGGRGPKRTPVDRSEVYVKRKGTALPDKYSGGKGRGKWWNPPKEASPVKGLDQIIKENEEKAKPRKEKSRSDVRTRIGGGSPSSSLVRGLLRTPRR
tara:strand:+ start:253 stop:585 length:333 start_codon:yes stop_codon:yes gene_type:complete